MRLPIARLLAALAISALLPACGSVEIRPEESRPYVLDRLAIDFPVGGPCVSIELELKITQPPNGVQKAATTRVTSGHSISLGNAVDFDLRERIKIVATVVSIVGNCPPLQPGDQLVFEDVMARQPNGNYVADMTKFKLVAQPR